MRFKQQNFLPIVHLKPFILNHRSEMEVGISDQERS